MKFGDIGREMGKRWRALTQDEKDAFKSGD